MFTTDASIKPLIGICMYFLRLSTKKYLGEETFHVKELLASIITTVNILFQREVIGGMLSAAVIENLLWNIERTVSQIFIPLLTNKCLGDKGSDQLSLKVRKELLPCLRSFTRLIFVERLIKTSFFAAL